MRASLKFDRIELSAPLPSSSLHFLFALRRAEASRHRFALAHVFAVFGPAVPAIAFVVIHLGLGVHPDHPGATLGSRDDGGSRWLRFGGRDRRGRGGLRHGGGNGSRDGRRRSGTHRGVADRDHSANGVDRPRGQAGSLQVIDRLIRPMTDDFHGGAVRASDAGLPNQSQRRHDHHHIVQ